MHKNTCQNKRISFNDYIPSKINKVNQLLLTKQKNVANISVSEVISTGNADEFFVNDTDNDVTSALPKKKIILDLQSSNDSYLCLNTFIVLCVWNIINSCYFLNVSALNCLKINESIPPFPL